RAEDRVHGEGRGESGDPGQVREAPVSRRHPEERHQMRRACIFLALAVTIWAASIEKPHSRRAAFVAMEQSFDQKLKQLADDPFLLSGATRGVYLEGYGAVFTAEVNLADVPSLSPFRPTITKEDIGKIRAKKLRRFPELRQF